MESPISFTLSYTGSTANDRKIDLYDVGQALVGFHKSLALTTHLILNGEVITQAPSLKGAYIRALPPEEGSWKMKVAVGIIGGALIAPKDSLGGHLIYSAYDYVISLALGINNVTYDKPLGQQISNDRRAQELLDQSKFDAVAEKCEPSIKAMHRPITHSKTATKAEISSKVGQKTYRIKHPLDQSTFNYIKVTRRSRKSEIFFGRVLSFSATTFTGRIYIEEENQTVPFELTETASNQTIVCIADSLKANTRKRHPTSGLIRCEAYRLSSAAGSLKRILIRGAWK